MMSNSLWRREAPSKSRAVNGKDHAEHWYGDPVCENTKPIHVATQLTHTEIVNSSRISRTKADWQVELLDALVSKKITTHDTDCKIKEVNARPNAADPACKSQSQQVEKP